MKKFADGGNLVSSLKKHAVPLLHSLDSGGLCQQQSLQWIRDKEPRKGTLFSQDFPHADPWECTEGSTFLCRLS